MTCDDTGEYEKSFRYMNELSCCMRMYAVRDRACY